MQWDDHGISRISCYMKLYDIQLYLYACFRLAKVAQPLGQGLTTISLLCHMFGKRIALLVYSIYEYAAYGVIMIFYYDLW